MVNSQLFCKTYRLTDSLDYVVPYEFEAETIENSRKLTPSDVPYTVCLPYSMYLPYGAQAYKLSERSGNTLVFMEIEFDEQMEALHPYLLMVYDDEDMQGDPFTLNTYDAQTIPASTGLRMEQDDAPGYSVRGTLSAIGNEEAADMGAYILQDDGLWHPVRTTTKTASVQPFRAYLLPSARNAAARIGMTLTGSDDATTIDRIQTVDRDGTTRTYDLQGRQIDGTTAKGVVIRNGKKVMVK